MPNNVDGTTPNNSESDRLTKGNSPPRSISAKVSADSIMYPRALTKVLMPVSIERSVWEYFPGKAEQRGIELSELVTEVLKRDIQIHKALE